MEMPYDKKLEAFGVAVMQEDEDLINRTGHELLCMTNDLCVMDVDRMLNRMLGATESKIDSPSLNIITEQVRNTLSQHAKLCRFYRAFAGADQNEMKYRYLYHEMVEHANDPDVAIYMQQMLYEFGICAMPDVILVGRKHPNTRAFEITERCLGDSWKVTCAQFCSEGLNEEIFKNIAVGYLGEAFEWFDNIPQFVAEAMTPHFEEIVEHDIKMLTESYSGDELKSKLESYNEEQLDIGGAYQIMANIMLDGAMCMESYIYCMDMFETIGERCERESNYLATCEAAYRQTGKRPRYISNTYSFDPEAEPMKKDDEWINPPDDEDDTKGKKKKSEEPPEIDDDKSERRGRNGAVYNITYQNSFNKSSSVRDSYHHNRTNSDDTTITGGGKAYPDQSPEDWVAHRKLQKKLVSSYASHKALSAPPEDLRKSYLRDIQWKDNQKKRYPPWVILPDTQTGRPREDIGYRKYLAKKIEQMADDRDIEYDGSLIVAGDAVDGIYDIEVSQFNEPDVIEQLRKAASAVVRVEMKAFEKSNTGDKKLDEALDYLAMFHESDEWDDRVKEAADEKDDEDEKDDDDHEDHDDHEEMTEEVKGGDPEKDRPIGQRIQNSIQGYNARQQKKLNAIDRGLRTGRNIVQSAVQTPMQLINVAKNFISDCNNRKEQDLKEDILKDNKFRMRAMSLMRSVLKTALPWAIAGPVWGTLFNIVALPIRGIKHVVTDIRGGPHRDLIIEMREELRTEMQIIDDMIAKAKTDDEKHKLMREKSRMEQEYYKIAAKVHFDPIAAKHRRRGED